MSLRENRTTVWGSQESAHVDHRFTCRWIPLRTPTRDGALATAPVGHVPVTADLRVAVQVSACGDSMSGYSCWSAATGFTRVARRVGR